MKLLKFIFIFFLIASCSSKTSLEGTYYYKGSIPNSAESKVVIEAKKEIKELTGQDGLYAAFIFKGEKTVMVKSVGLDFAASYSRDGDYITVSDANGELILKVVDQNTLHGEGFASGLYIKLKPGEKLPELKQNQSNTKPKRIRTNTSSNLEVHAPIIREKDTASNNSSQ